MPYVATRLAVNRTRHPGSNSDWSVGSVPLAADQKSSEKIGRIPEIGSDPSVLQRNSSSGTCLEMLPNP